MRRFQRMSLAGLLTAISGIGASAPRTAPQPDQIFGNIPLGFEANAGQTDASVKYFARGNGYTAFLTNDGAVIQLLKKVHKAGTAGSLSEASAEPERRGSETVSAAVRMRFVGGESNLSISPSGPTPGRISYVNDGDKSEVVRPALFQKIQYRDVWPGVSMVFYGNRRQLEYDLIVAPGAPPSAIQLDFEDAKDVRVDRATGELVLSTEIGELRQGAPVIYQETDGRRVTVDGRYTVTGRQVGFEVGNYDQTKQLVIDPTLTFGVTWGGSGQDYAEAVVVDPSSGAIYVAGYTSSPDFPTTTGASLHGSSDAFISKVSPDGSTLLFSTYIGGSFDDDARGIALDRSGNVYITGQTQSSDFPVTFDTNVVPFVVCLSCGPSPAYEIQPKFFVVELSPAGSMLFSEVFGGSGANYGNAIAIGDTGVITVVGRTYSTDFPIVNSSAYLHGPSDAFVTVLSPPGQGSPAQILFSTLIGGTGDESAKSVAMIPVLGRPRLALVGPMADIVVGGWTSSYDFPATTGVAQPGYGGGDADGFIVRILVVSATEVAHPDLISGSITYATYLGGEGEDVVFSVAVDSSGNVYLTGYTGSYRFPKTYGCFQPYYGGGNTDAFLVKLDGNGRLLYGSYFGGAGDDYGRAVLVGFGAEYLIGYTNSPNLPVTSDALQSTEAGRWDTFAAWFLDNDATLAYATYLGSWGDDFAYAAALDHEGNLIFAGSTDETNSGATNVLLVNIDVGHVHTF